MIRLSKIDKNLFGTIKLPASKSISNRLLILQYAYGHSFTISNLSTADDTVLMSTMLDLVRQYQVRGDTGLLRLDTRNAGSVMRFMLPLLSVTRGHYLLTGNERMKKRPIGALVEAMRETGAEIDYLEDIGFPPLIIRGRAISASRIGIDTSVSSQFVTALLLLAPTMPDGLTIELTGSRASWPYVKMTTRLLNSLGVQVITQENSIRVFNKKALKSDIEVEPDWSSAAFWYSMVSMAENGEIFFPALKKSGIQGDQELASFFSQLGVTTTEKSQGILIRKEGRFDDNFMADFAGYPDIALPVIVSCGVAGIPGTFTGLDNLRIKESDRLEALSLALRMTGIAFREESPGTWKLSGRMVDPCRLHMDDFDDHRVAMTLAGLAIKGFTIQLEHPETVNKSFPGFWKELESAGFKCDISC